jgi:hypothetical protein
MIIRKTLSCEYLSKMKLVQSTKGGIGYRVMEGWRGVLRKGCLGSVKTNDSKSNHKSKWGAYNLLKTAFQSAFSLLCFLSL